GGVASREAAHALGKILTPAAYEVLADALAAGIASAPGRIAPAPDVIPELLLAVWRHPRQPRTTGLALPYLDSRDRAVRFGAAYALMRTGGATAMPGMVRALRDSDAEVRQIAARALRAVLADSAGVR